jgi:hypothetical protein
MDLSSIKNLSQRECQRRFFIDSLYRELEKATASTSHRNSSMLKRANELLFSERLPKDACVDMLIMEGFEDRSSRECIESLASSDKEELDVAIGRYDYCFEDHRGRTFTGRELGNIVEASSDDEAKEVISQTLSDFDPPVHLISIDKIG